MSQKGKYFCLLTDVTSRVNIKWMKMHFMCFQIFTKS